MKLPHEFSECVMRAFLWLLLSSSLATSELFPDEAARAGADPYPIARGDASAEPAEVVIDLSFGRKTALPLPRARGASEAARCLAKARAIRRNATLSTAKPCRNLTSKRSFEPCSI